MNSPAEALSSAEDLSTILDSMAAALIKARREESEAHEAMLQAKEKQREAVRQAASKAKDNQGLLSEFIRYVFWNLPDVGCGTIAKSVGANILDLARIASTGLRCSQCSKAPDLANTRDMRRVLQFRGVRVERHDVDAMYQCRVCKPGMGDPGYGALERSPVLELDREDGDLR